MAIRSRRQTVAGGAPFCLQAQRSQGNPSHVWQHYKQSGRQDVNQGGPLSCLDLGGGARSLVFARFPGLGRSLGLTSQLRAATCAKPWSPHQSVTSALLPHRASRRRAADPGRRKDKVELLSLATCCNLDPHGHRPLAL